MTVNVHFKDRMTKYLRDDGLAIEDAAIAIF